MEIFFWERREASQRVEREKREDSVLREFNLEGQAATGEGIQFLFLEKEEWLA